MKKEIIVFNDTKNKVLDPIYAEKLIQSFRNLTGWKVEKGTRIWKDLRKFSKGYSKINRDPVEVAVIFKIANGI